MKKLDIGKLDEKKVEIAKALIALGLGRPVARTLAYLNNGHEVTSDALEKGTGLRQPEVSIVMRQLNERDWINEREEKKGKRRPYKIYSLKVVFNNIIAQLEKERKEREVAKEKLARIEHQLPKKDKEHHEIEEKNRILLGDKKLYDEDTHLLICPICSNYSVRYFKISKKWFCNSCDSEVNIKNSFIRYDLNFTDDDKYEIYSFWGIGALSLLTDESKDKTKSFVAKYFKKRCLSRGGCLYAPLLNEKKILKQISSIGSLFKNAKIEYNILRINIEEFLSKSVQKENKEIYSIKKIVEQIAEELDAVEEKLDAVEKRHAPLSTDCFVVAKTDLKKDQKVYVYDGFADLINTNGIQKFAFNNANKNDMVGVFIYPSESLDKLKQLFEYFKKNSRCEELIQDCLPSLDS